jgi:crotonobetaine/carnitine-CoA ligase
VREFSFAERTLPALLEAQALVHPEKVLVQELPTGVKRTYLETRDQAARYAGTLAQSGVEAGDRITIICSNRIEFLDLWLGCGWQGAIAAPINTAVKGLQLEHVLGNSDPKVIVVEDDLLERLDNIEVELPSLERIWVVGDGANGKWRGVALEPFPEPSDPIAPHAVHPGDVFSILYTSGTTGPSKGVMCPHAQFYWYAVNTARHLEVGEDSVLYTILPMFHVNALHTFVQALLCEATYVFGKRFSASNFWREIGASGATVTYLLGAMIHILLKREPSPEERDHRLRTALCPGISPDLVDVVQERFGFLGLEGYGSTETSQTHSNRLFGYVPACMGRPFPWIEARVVDQDDQELPPGTPGELIFRHSEPFGFASGYWRMPEKTVEAWRNLWFHSGDRVVVDEDGVFHFMDRLKDSIRRRGENISSFEVELALQTHPSVASAAVVPVPSELGEDEVMAFVVLRQGVATDPVEIIRHLEPRLAYFAIPRFLEFVEVLPQTENGKVKKFELRERGVGRTTWDREAAGIEVRR